MRRLALVLILVSGCTFIYGPSKVGNTHGHDMARDDLSLTHLPGDAGPTRDLKSSVVWSKQAAATLQNLYAINGCSATDLFAPGTGGTLDRSTTAATWNPMLLGANDLLAVTTSTCANTYVVGKAGVTFYSSDGVNFRQRTAGSADLTGVWSNGVGVAAVGTGGGAFYVALGSNGGFSSRTSGTTSDLEAVWGSGASFYAGGADGTILRSSNSGQSWTAMTVGTARLRAGWASASGNDVYAVGDGGVILHSSDGGTSWPAASSGTSASLRGVWGSAPNDVFAVGEAGTILHSSDGGTTWFIESGNTSVNLNGVWGSSASDVYAVGDSGTILHRP
jgi:photosystem II stability/assembly factor-like uncharacterized protein